MLNLTFKKYKVEKRIFNYSSKLYKELSKKKLIFFIKLVYLLLIQVKRCLIIERNNVFDI